MRIIKSRKIASTPWQVEPYDQAREMSETSILPLEQWLLMRDDRPCRRSGSCPGVLLQPDDCVQELAGEIDRLPVIAINAAGFADGRVYTLALALREEYQYRGELRALGATLDNLAMLERCGFDAFELKDGTSVEDALHYFSEIGPVYGFWQQ